MDVYRTVLEADRELTVQERAAPVRVAVGAIALIESRAGARRAEPLWRAIADARELHLVNSTPYGRAGLLHDLGRVLWAQRKYAEAEPVYREAVEIRLSTAGPDHFSTGWSMVWLGRTLLKLQRADEAVPWLRRALPVYERSIGQDDPDTILVRDDLAEAVDASSEKTFTHTAPSYPAVPGSR